MQEQKNSVEKLQSLPYHTRLRIMWGTVAVVGLLLILLIVQSIKSTVGSAGGDLININGVTDTEKNYVNSPVDFASVERVERMDNTLKIYFNLNNTTDDILNVPKLGDMTLETKSGALTAEKITDRQGQIFVQKILSHTQNFGVLTFPNTSENSATLHFDEIFLEKNPSSFFQQKLELNLEELSKKSEVRE